MVNAWLKSDHMLQGLKGKKKKSKLKIELIRIELI